MLLFSRLVVSNSSVVVIVQLPCHVWLFVTRGLQHDRLPCPSPSSGVCPSSSQLHRWCHPAISSSDALSSSSQSFPESGTFPMSQLFTTDDQNTGVSASASVLPMSIQGWFPIRLTGWISLQFKGLSRVFSNTTVKSINSSALHLLYGPAVITVHDHWEVHNLDYKDLCLCFSTHCLGLS